MKTIYSVRDYRAAARPHLKAVVRWKDDSGKRQAKMFATKAEAKTFAQQRETELLNQGRESLTISTPLRVMAQRCEELLAPFGKTIDDATRHYIEALKARSASRDIGRVLVEFLAQKKAQGVCSQYYATLRTKLGNFAKRHPSKLVSDVTMGDCNDFLTSLDVGGRSRNFVRLALVCFFNFAKHSGYCESNPAEKSSRTKVIAPPPGVVTPDELARLLEAACPQTLVFIAIAAFAGVRVAELLRLDWREIDLEEGFIEILAAKSKTATRRLIKIQPCLRAWLELFAKPRGPVVTSRTTIFKLLENTRARAGMIVWPKNALRHSFASYHLAQFKDAPALALEMGHAGCNMIFEHYRQIVRQSDALRYWNVVPAEPGKVLEMAIANHTAPHPSHSQPRVRVEGAGAPFISAAPWRRSYAKTQRQYAKMYGVHRSTIQKWQDLGRPLDDADAMAQLLKQRYALPLGEYCGRYGKQLNTIKIWAKAGWPLDDPEAIKSYIAARKFTHAGKSSPPANKALRVLTMPEPAPVKNPRIPGIVKAG